MCLPRRPAVAYLFLVRRHLHTHDEREAHGVKLQPITGMTWAVFFARVVLGLIFFMAGIYKVFQQGPIGHVKQWFLPYSNTFLPIWSLWLVGLTIPRCRPRNRNIRSPVEGAALRLS